MAGRGDGEGGGGIGGDEAVNGFEFWARWHFHLLRRRARSLAARVVTMIHPWIHTPGDGRGQRQVYLDGEPVYMCVYANTRTGVIRAHHDPVKFCPRREVARSYKRRGNVRVEAMG